MPALRFLALLTLAFVLPGGAFLWHQQLARLEREATRVLTGPALACEPGAAVTWRLDLAGSRESEAWMDPQQQPWLRCAPAPGVRVRATARYLAAGPFPEAPAFIGAASRTADAEGRFGPLWLSFVQPLEVTLEVLEAPPGGGAALQPVLAGEVSADYALARKLERTVYWAFLAIGAFGVALLVWTARGLPLFEAPTKREEVR